MKIQTVNQLISVFKDVATRHYQINGFGIGDDWESGATENMHPVLWVNPVTASMPSSDNGYKTFEIDFDIRIFDLVSKDESNENDVLSDCIDILKDIISEFKRHPYYVNSQLNIIDDISFEAFTEELDEEVSGWSCEITLMTPILNTFCGIPSADITGFEFPSNDCPEVNVLCPVFVEDVTGVHPIVVTTVGTTKEISIVGGGASDTYVISGTYNDATDNLELLRNDGVTVLTDLSSVGGGVDTNTFVLSGSFDSVTKQLTLTKNDASDVVISGFTDENDNDNDYTTGATLTGNIITFDRTDTTSAYSVDLTSVLGGGDNIANANLQLDDNRTVDLNSKTLSIGTLELGVDATIKGSDTSASTSGFKVINADDDVLIDLRNNGQTGINGAYDGSNALMVRNPNNEPFILELENFAGTPAFQVTDSGQLLTKQLNAIVFYTYRQGGQSRIQLFDGAVKSFEFNKILSFTTGQLVIDGTTGKTKSILTLNQASANITAQNFFANITTTTAGRVASSSAFGIAEKGFECFDTDLNKKCVWNGSAWEQITSVII